MFTGGKWLAALANSLRVGLAATALALVLGTLAALGLARWRHPLAAVLKVLMLVTTLVLYAAAHRLSGGRVMAVS